MAIIDDTTQEDVSKIRDLKTIDINDTSLPDGKEETINPNADAWERAAPPPDGFYLVRLHESRLGYQMGKTDDGELFYRANLDCKIIDNEEWKDVTVFGNVSTFISAGKEISTCAGLIKKFGVTIQPKSTHKAILQLLRKCIMKEPKIWVEGEWGAWDMPKGEWIKKGMKSFPRTEDGKGYQHVVRDSKGNQVVAKFKIVKWWGLKEYAAYLEKEKARKAQQSSNQRAQQAQSQGQGQGKPNGEVVDNFQEVQGGASTTTTASAKMPDDDFVIDE